MNCRPGPSEAIAKIPELSAAQAEVGDQLSSGIGGDLARLEVDEHSLLRRPRSGRCDGATVGGERHPPDHLVEVVGEQRGVEGPPGAGAHRHDLDRTLSLIVTGAHDPMVAGGGVHRAVIDPHRPSLGVDLVCPTGIVDDPAAVRRAERRPEHAVVLGSEFPHVAREADRHEPHIAVADRVDRHREARGAVVRELPPDGVQATDVVTELLSIDVDRGSRAGQDHERRAEHPDRCCVGSDDDVAASEERGVWLFGVSDSDRADTPRWQRQRERGAVGRECNDLGRRLNRGHRGRQLHVDRSHRTAAGRCSGGRRHGLGDRGQGRCRQ